jgi:alpha-tubulin suppressor-like RCC1 family protein
MEPLNIEFEVQSKEKNDSSDIVLEAFLDENKKHKKINTEYINEFETISWGIDHCLFIDKKRRVFSMGFGKYGRLGHGDEKDRLKP